MLKDDFNSEFGKKVWDSSFGVFFPDEPEPEENEEKSTYRLDTSIEDAPALKPESEKDLIIDAFKEFQDEPLEEDKKSVSIPTAPKTLEDKVASSGIIISEPYGRGEDILSEILTYCHCNILAGKPVKFVLEEDSNCILATSGLVYGSSVMIGGRSRSGKSLIFDKIITFLTQTYSVKSCSNKAFFGAAEKMNECDFIYIIEYQAAVAKNQDVKEGVKNMTEGKDATNDSNGETKRVIAKPIFTTGADENKQIQGMDVEVSGRFTQLRTSSSEEKKRRIEEYQDGLDTGKISNIEFSQERFDRLKQYIANRINDKKSTFEDPFATSFYKEYLPSTQKGVYCRTLYKDQVKGIANLVKPNRVTKEDKIFTNIFDVYFVNEHHRQTYCDNLRELTERGFEALLKNFKDNPMTIETLNKEYEKEIQEIEDKRNIQVNWQEVWDKAYNHMKENHLDLLQEWVNLQSKDGKVVVYDTVKKVDVYLCDVI